MIQNKKNSYISWDKYSYASLVSSCYDWRQCTLYVWVGRKQTL